MTNQATKIVNIKALEPLARAIVGAYKKVESAQVSIGTAVIKAGATVKIDQVETFVGMIRGQLESVLSPSSLKVEATRLRRVLKAVIAGDITATDGMTLRQLYDACPKDASKGGPKTGPRVIGKEESTPMDSVSVTPEQKADKFKAAITLLFGYCEPDLITAMQYATANATVFMKWAGASSQAALVAELESALDKTPKPTKKAPKKAKAVATA